MIYKQTQKQINPDIQQIKKGGEGGNTQELCHSNKPLTYLEQKNCEPSIGDSKTNIDVKSDNIDLYRDGRYRGLPVCFLVREDGVIEPSPFLMSFDDVAAFFRLAYSRTRFPRKTIERYRRLGLQSVRIGRRVWFRLDDVLRFLDRQQDRLQ